MPRHDGRSLGEIRPVTIERGFVKTSAGSVLYRAGGTVVLVTANISDKVPPFLEGRNVGWVTAEYSMLPGSTQGRKSRGPDGRSSEIQRLIGRSLRAAVDTKALGPRTLHLDADVLQADGGTRTASITGAFVAMVDAIRTIPELDPASVLKDSVAAVSVGLVGDEAVADLDYPEDSNAGTDFNVVRLGSGGFVEVQGTGEGGVFSKARLIEMVNLAESALDRLREIQRAVLGSDWPFKS